MNVVIDKVCLLYTIASKDEFNHILHWLHNLSKDLVGKSYWKGKYHSTFKTQLKGGNYLVLKIGTSKGSLWLDIEFNAGKFIKDDWIDFYSICTMLFEDGYTGLYQQLRIKRMEFAVDIPGIAFKEVNSLDIKIKGFEFGFMKDGSRYLGTKNSKREILIYDKAKQLHEVGHVTLAGDLLRIEARIRDPELLLKDIHNIKNPFLPLRLFDLSLNKDHIGLKGNVFTQFIEFIEEGIDPQIAFLSFDAISRQVLSGRLSYCKVPWWKSGDAWEKAKKHLLMFEPDPADYLV